MIHYLIAYHDTSSGIVTGVVLSFDTTVHLTKNKPLALQYGSASEAQAVIDSQAFQDAVSASSLNGSFTATAYDF